MKAEDLVVVEDLAAVVKEGLDSDLGQAALVLIARVEKEVLLDQEGLVEMGVKAEDLEVAADLVENAEGLREDRDINI